LVAACRAAGVTVDPIPGASAALVAAVGSGFPLNSLTFLGFPPLKAKARKEWFRDLAALGTTTVFFEAPHRIGATLAEIGARLGTRQICVGRELTKAHQEFVIGPANGDAFLAITRKGEFAVVVGPRTSAPAVSEPVSDAVISEAFLAFTKSTAGSGKRAAAAAIAKRFGLTPNEVYRAVERVKL